MQQMKSLKIIHYFESIGVVVCIMESAANSINGGIATTRIGKLHSMDLTLFPAVRRYLVQFRHILVHNPLNIVEISKILNDISKSELYNFLLMLVKYVQLDISSVDLLMSLDVLYYIIENESSLDTK